MSGRFGGERGSVTAELALALPVVVLTLLLGASALGAAARQVALQDASADAARVLGRGEAESAASRVANASAPGANVSSSDRGDIVCVTVSDSVEIGGFIEVPLRASSCALAGGL